MAADKSAFPYPGIRMRQAVSNSGQRQFLTAKESHQHVFFLLVF